MIVRKEKIKDRLNIEDELRGVKGPSLNGKVRGVHHKRLENGEIETKPLKGPEFDKDGFTKNLVVYSGREWAFDKVFDYPGSTITSYKLFWFGVGEGGATTDDPLVPLYPSDQDLDLYSPVVLDASNSTFADSGYKKPLPSGSFFKTINLLAIVFTVYIDFNEANGSGQTNLNELALYLSPTQDPTEDTFKLFSHVCVGTRPKTSQDAYTFEWWVYV